jgi:hypothetical protein
MGNEELACIQACTSVPALESCLDNAIGAKMTAGTFSSPATSFFSPAKALAPVAKTFRTLRNVNKTAFRPVRKTRRASVAVVIAAHDECTLFLGIA